MTPIWSAVAEGSGNTALDLMSDELQFVVAFASNHVETTN
jgi:hypothetical protein